MQFLLRILALILIGFILLCFVVGFTNDPHTEITHTKVVNSPSTVVWQSLTSPGRISEWMHEVRLVTGPVKPGKNAVYRFYLYNYDNDAFHDEKIDIYNPENRISFLRVEDKNRPLLRNYLKLFELKQLRDGMTELTFTLSYRSDSFLTIVYDKLLLRQRMESRVASDLENLKRKLEKL